MDEERRAQLRFAKPAKTDSPLVMLCYGRNTYFIRMPLATSSTFPDAANSLVVKKLKEQGFPFNKYFRLTILPYLKIL